MVLGVDRDELTVVGLGQDVEVIKERDRVGQLIRTPGTANSGLRRQPVPGRRQGRAVRRNQSRVCAAIRRDCRSEPTRHAAVLRTPRREHLPRTAERSEPGRARGRGARPGITACRLAGHVTGRSEPQPAVWPPPGQARAGWTQREADGHLRDNWTWSFGDTRGRKWILVSPQLVRKIFETGWFQPSPPNAPSPANTGISASTRAASRGRLSSASTSDCIAR